ncbi:hypothetical protein O6H91_23G024900 [Diphasiastrum complanatum]|uniref:Uncharacterized protein n=2 Tax=Diphasiastrum complanatum TaxID=34168 RepID=A0ACC2A915_DIPCM|nr:hypothetical protein O6H91_23G024900 [Diphasiastrum complanatum]KAJ7514062.1 hypothetical protein O6H91_23G024900 [Diphasiastrum complanatum]
MMASVMSETHAVSPSALSVPVQTIFSGQGAQSYVPVGIHPKISSATSSFVRFGSLSLNPNAEEFVPSSSKVGNATSENSSSLIKSTIINHFERKTSADSDISDDEYRQYVRAQLPDDILPDFDVSMEATVRYEQPHSSELVDYGNDTGDIDQPCSYKSEQGYVETTEQSLWQLPLKCNTSLAGSTSYTPYNSSSNNSSYGFKPQRSALINQTSLSQRAIKPSLGSDLQVGFHKDITKKSTLSDLGPAQSLDLLAAKFPNFAVESLAQILFSYGGDLGLTVKTLSQVELQDRTPPRQSQLSAAAAPYMSVTSIPSPSSFTLVNGHSQHHEDADYRPLNTNNCAEFSSLYWQQEGKRGMDIFSGPLKPSHSSGEGNLILDSRVSSQERVGQNIIGELSRMGRQSWFVTGDAVAGVYSEKQHKEPDHARMSNVYYEHARQAHIAGKETLATELNAKGQWHSEQLKLGHIKAGDIVGRQNSCFVNRGHTGHHSPLRPGNIFIH